MTEVRGCGWKAGCLESWFPGKDCGGMHVNQALGFDEIFAHCECSVLIGPLKGNLLQPWHHIKGTCLTNG